MSENLSKQEPHGVNRRDVLKTLGLGAALGAGGIAINHEVEKLQEGGVDTPYGLFTGIYEVHLDRPLTKDKLPKKLDGLFREIALPMSDTLAYPEHNILAKGVLLGGIEQERALSDDVLMQLAQEETPLIFGDISIDPKKFFIEQVIIPTGVAGASYEAQQRLKRRIKKDPSKNIARRRILKAGLSAAQIGVAAYLAGNVSKLAANYIEPNEAVNRILTRMGDIGVHSNPASEGLFFRNAVIADKLLTVGEHMKNTNGTKPHIGFSIGGAHSGIEDFLEAGPDFCRAVINAYPDFILDDLLERNGGTHAFSSAVLYKLPTQLTPEALQSVESLRAYGGIGNVITDTKLEQSLNLR